MLAAAYLADVLRHLGCRAVPETIEEKSQGSLKTAHSVRKSERDGLITRQDSRTGSREVKVEVEVSRVDVRSRGRVTPPAL